MRLSRKCYNSKFFHVMIQGIRKEKIFKENYLKSTFVNYMDDAAEKNKVRIIAYCVMDNHAHILVYIKEMEELSKMMHSLNTRYAMKYNKYKERCGFVFRNRYRCENILNITYLKNCIRYIHNNPVKAGICKEQGEYYYSSYRDYISGKIGMKLINKIFGDAIEYIFELNKPVESEHTFIDVDNELGNNYKISPQKVIKDFYLENNIVPECITKSQQVKLIKLLKEKYGLKQVEICKLLNMNRKRIYRLLEKHG